MKAVVCRDTELTVADLPDPVPSRGQLLLRVLRCGICGSDLHARRHADELHEAATACGYPDAMAPGDSVVFGHEFLGEVIDSRRGFRSGDRVVAMPMVRVDGAVQLTGLTPLAPGAYAEQVVAEASLALKVPNGLDDDTATLTEPMAVALHAVRRACVGRGQLAVVTGCGPIGLAVVAMLKATGVRTVVASDFSARRRALATAVGADVVVDPADADVWDVVPTGKYFRSVAKLLDLAVDSMDKLRAVPMLPWPRLMQIAEIAGLTPGGPVVFECVGVPGVIDQIITHAPLATRVVVVGVTMAPDTIRPSIAINKEIDLRFVFGYTPRDFHDALHLLADGKVRSAPLLTGTVGLAGVDGAFTALSAAQEHAKILVDPTRRGTRIQKTPPARR